MSNAVAQYLKFCPSGRALVYATDARSARRTKKAFVARGVSATTSPSAFEEGDAAVLVAVEDVDLSRGVDAVIVENKKPSTLFYT